MEENQNSGLSNTPSNSGAGQPNLVGQENSASTPVGEPQNADNLAQFSQNLENQNQFSTPETPVVIPASEIPTQTPIAPIDEIKLEDQFLGNSEVKAEPETPNFGEKEPHYPIADEPKPENSGNSIITWIIVIILVATGIWYFNKGGKPEAGNGNINEEDNVNITVNPNPEQGEVKIINANEAQEAALGEKVKITAFYSNVNNDPGMADCSKVYALEREAEKKYDSDVVNTIRGLLFALTAEETANGWRTSVPTGAALKYVKINNGVAEANFSSTLNQIGGSCAVTAVRAQITQTLLQFPYVTSVVICIDGNCNQEEILQP